ncbi:MAG: hypothetical protein P8P81_02845 [Bacteroidia bacterium]|nr:hypothetical protein [Bacteroidia bacterium]
MEANIIKTHSRLSFFSKSSKLKWIIAFMLFLPIVFSAQKSHATHMMGADIGEIMFITNDVNEKWDGMYKGEPAQQDVYAYQLNVTALNDEVYNYTGTITLIR